MTTADSVPPPPRDLDWLLTEIADGLALTAAGYLPPRTVSRALDELGWREELIGPANREVDAYPVLVLRETAQLLLGKVRSSSDSCYRYGGDEFIVIMPETQAKTALVVAERLREGLYERFQQQISASLGIAEYNENLDAKSLIVKADQAMYAAKQKGGNCIVVAE